jgi:hypothetical protein
MVVNEDARATRDAKLNALHVWSTGSSRAMTGCVRSSSLHVPGRARSGTLTGAFYGGSTGPNYPSPRGLLDIPG